MHPFRKLRESGPVTPAQAAVVLNENVVLRRAMRLYWRVSEGRSVANHLGTP